MIEVKSTGLVYRNPKPYLRSIHAWHPTIVPLGNGGMLAGFDLAEAISAANYRSYMARSNDGGRTWSEPQRLVPGHTEITDFIRLSRLSDGTLIGVGQRKQPDLETQSWNPETYGCRPGEWFTIRSADNGETWSGTEVFEPAITGQPWEHCHAALETADGRLLLPAALVRTWEGEAPNGLKTVALVSHDRGATWPDSVGLFSDPEGETFHHEVSLIELPDGGLLAVAWPFNPGVGRTVTKVPFALAPDGGDFTVRGSTEIPGETTKLVALGGNRVMSFMRRTDQPGLWACVSRIEGDRWINEAEAPVWQGADSRMLGDGRAAEELAGLQFGFPNPHLLEDGDVFVAFWCLEDCIHNIRWVRVGVEQ
ncbi:MAG: sialidase family protein [Gemmatimonadetes bacterium]|nr:sialidase family protein [Gemmatimonadota bacterium]